MRNGLFSLDGCVAAVIGGGGVLGGAMAAGLAQAGAEIAILDCHAGNAATRAHALELTGRKSIGVACDASRKADLERACGTVLESLGRVDILVNSAGVNSGTPFFEITEEEWQRVLDVDLKSVFLACQVFGKAMVEACRGGSIINISSIASGPPLSKVLAYDVAKAGVNQITQFLAREFAPQGIRVNAILPGFFPAEQNRKLLTQERVASALGHTPMKRFGEDPEIAGAAVYLASAASSYVTGTLLYVDGGFHAMSI